MSKYKAKKIESYYDKHFTTIVYYYRGKTYEVNYPVGASVCCTPAWVQHQTEQAKIDKLIDNPDPITETKIDLEEIWSLMGWD